MAVAPSYAVLCLAMVMTGGFNAAIWVPASARVASAVSERHRGLASGALGMGYGLAIVFAGQLAAGGTPRPCRPSRRTPGAHATQPPSRTGSGPSGPAAGRDHGGPGVQQLPLPSRADRAEQRPDASAEQQV